MKANPATHRQSLPLLALVLAFTSSGLLGQTVPNQSSHSSISGSSVSGPIFRCHGDPGSATQGSAKVAARAEEGQRAAIVLFAHFADENVPATVPAWSASLFDPQQPGSVAHYFDSMSFGRFELRGQVAPRYYAAAGPARSYLAAAADQRGGYGQFALEVIRTADADIDFTIFDNDGPDEVPNSGDDDGFVDVLFLNVATAPTGFLLRDATGISNLGFDAIFDTDDIGFSGQPIRIDPREGTVQATPDLHHAAGVMAHEFGHLLGLPDLFDTQWTDNPTTPERDSAGIGRWGLMGWGALGWDDAPGPAALSAWSRFRLGWAQVDLVEGRESEVEIEPVAWAGQMSQILLSGNEYFLLEYRDHAASYYDRGIPADGLLVWHVRRAEVEGDLAFWWDVDLECADGRWADAGYPSGSVSAPLDGEDNLDFWAHDAAYMERHAGNLGDATDPFDGVRFDRLSSVTNPAAVSSDGINDVTIEQISVVGDRVSFVVRNNPPSIELQSVTPRSPRVTAGTPMAITFHLKNVGGTPAAGLHAVLRSDDDTIEILNPAFELFPLAAGAGSIGRGVGPGGFPRIRFPADLAQERTASLELVIFAGSTQVASSTIEVTGVPARPLIVSVLSQDSTPLADVKVSLTGDLPTADTFFEKLISSDSSGIAVFHVPDGSYSLRAEPGRDSSWGAEQLFGIDVFSDSTRVVFNLRRSYTLSGVVRDAHGQPVESHFVVLRNENGSDSWAARTERQGAFSARVPAGTYRVTTQPLSGGAVPQDHGLIEMDANKTLDLQLEAGLRLSVHVVDTQGNPVGGARVSARPEGESFSTLGSITTHDREADLEVQPGNYIVGVSNVPAPFVVPREETQITVVADTAITLTVTRGAHVKARLVDESGQAVIIPPSRFFVNIEFSSNAYYVSGNLQPGPAEIELGVRPGLLDVRVSVFSSSTEDDLGFPTQGLGVVEIVGDTTLTLTVSSGVAVSGHVLGFRDGPNSSIFFNSRGNFASANIAPDGRFETRLIPGEYSASISFCCNDSAPPSQSFGTINVQNDTTITWKLLDSELITGTVIDASGDPVTELDLTASVSNSDQFAYNRATTGLDGTFHIRLPDGTYSINATRSFGLSTFVTWKLPDLDVPSPTPPQYIFPSGVDLTIQITDAEGLLQPGRVSMYTGPFRLADYLLAATTGSHQIDARIDPARQLEFDAAPGRFAVITSELFSQDVAYSQVIPEVVLDGPSVLELSLPPSRRDVQLSGSITGADGEPLATGVRLSLYDAGTGLLAESFAGSTYEIALPPGSYRIALLEGTSDGVRLAYMGGPIDISEDRVFDIALGVETAIEESDTSPHRFALEQNYPNPFNAETVIEFSIGIEGDSELVLFDLLGRRVRTLVDASLAAGPHRVQWDAKDDEGRDVATGIYFYRLTTPGRSVARKLLLIR